MLQALRIPRLLTREVLAGLVVAIALIPEAIAFSIIAGVDPRLGLFASFIMAVAIAFGTAAFSFFHAHLDSDLPLPEGNRIVALENWDVKKNKKF